RHRGLRMAVMVEVAGRDRKRTRADRVELGPAEAAVAVAVPHAHVVRRGSEVGRGEVEMAVAIEVGRDDAAWAAARGDGIRMKGERLSDGERGASEPNGERTQHGSHAISLTCASAWKEGCQASPPAFQPLVVERGERVSAKRKRFAGFGDCSA